MAAELVPITEFPIAEALPDYLQAERIGVNAELIGKIAHWGCFEPDVQIEAYSGQITSHNASIMGFESSGAAFMGATGTTEKAPLAQHEVGPSKLRSAYHVMHPLRIKMNVPEIQHRLSEDRADLRDPAPWARQLDIGISQQLRAASRKHLLADRSSVQELLYSVGLGGMLYGLSIIAGGLIAHELHPEIATPASIAATLLVDNGIKMAANKTVGRPMWDGCISVFPGFHIDRYAAVEALTRTRRLVRPIE